MAAQTVYLMGMGMFSPTVGIPIEEDSQGMTELPGNELPAPQLVMLANVAVTSESNGCENMAEEKEMMELKTVGSSSYSDSEDESVIRYSYENHREICIIDYPESPLAAVAQVENSIDEIEEEEEDDDSEGEEQEVEDEGVIEDLSKPANQKPSSPTTPGNCISNQAMDVMSVKKKKPFHCKACNYQAKCEEEFVQHIRIHSANKMVVVRRVEGGDTVDADETSPGLEFEPAVEGGDIKGVIRCERCGYNTNRYDHYLSHLKHHSKEGDNHRVYKCVICAYTTVSQYHWRKHLRNHFPSKLFTCSHCCYFSDRKNNYVQHIRTHTGERPFQCSQCEYSSSQKTHLTRHMRTHSGERPFKCDSCSYLAANQHEVTRHARQVHNGPKPLACPYCQYKTADRSNFKKHVELHLNPRQFLCPVCKYAASKKCNLQYHIKSRHPGCDNVNMDVSKVKLRAKKLESDELEKLNLSGIEEDQDQQEEAELSDTDKQSSPINLSTKSRKTNPVEVVKSGTFDKTNKKCETTPIKEKPRKAKDKVEKKVPAKRKKTEKDSENTKINMKIKKSLAKTVAAVENADSIKKSHKKQKIDKTSAQDKIELKETKEKVKKASLDIMVKERCDEDRLENDRMDNNPQKEKSEVMDGVQREKEGQPKKLNVEREDKESNNCESEKNGRPKMAEVAEKVVSEAPESKEVPVKNQGAKTKARAMKRKATEALDLSTKASPQEPCTNNKGKRLKVKTADKQQSKPRNTQRVPKNTEPCPASVKEGQANVMTDLPSVIKLKKTKKTNKKEKVVTPEINKVPMAEDSCSLHSSTEIQQSSEPKRVNRLLAILTANTEESTADKQLNLAEQEAPTAKETPSRLKKAEVSGETGETTGISSTRGNETPSPTEGGSSPTFRRPQAKPTSPSLELPKPRDKPTDTEEDEGIHSHDGGSDISDAASEGSDDSGLNGLQASSDGAGKLSDPETPTDEIPTPTELKSHMCIFCDRTFPLEVEYRRHLNRHLVNVYYLDSAEANQ